MLECRDLSVFYGFHQALDGVSLNIKSGEIVAILGANGAGKTTTFNLAVGNIKPDKGEVLMNGKNITNLPLPIRSRLGLGYLTQEASIFRDLTVKDLSLIHI